MLVLIGLQAGSALAGSGPEPVRLLLDELETPRGPAEWVAWEPLRRVVRDLAEPGKRLIIRHSGGDRGVLRARELAARLQSLGVAPDRIRLRPGGEAAALELTIETTEKGNEE
ncbi:hypothetical protein [Thiohalospira sp.]|uniref:hypothetical protein n=1 Tax=Thiohalospira sp. TaxID=3080549 RepID=UPI00397ED05C